MQLPIAFRQLRSAAVDLGHGPYDNEARNRFQGNHKLIESFRRETYNRILNQFQQIHDKGIEYVVLGAFGCGAFAMKDPGQDNKGNPGRLPTSARPNPNPTPNRPERAMLSNPEFTSMQIAQIYREMLRYHLNPTKPKALLLKVKFVDFAIYNPGYGPDNFEAWKDAMFYS